MIIIVIIFYAFALIISFEILTSYKTYDISIITLCTAYKTTVQTEQTVIDYHGGGSHR